LAIVSFSRRRIALSRLLAAVTIAGAVIAADSALLRGAASAGGHR
jgi:hypothetical protein